MTSDQQERLRDDVEARQRNILPHDQLRNTAGVDAFLWRGDPNATKVQRTALIVFGLLFLAAAVAFFGIAMERHLVLGGFMSLLWLALAIRLFRMRVCTRPAEMMIR